jgi:hypothetical protein
MLPDYFSPLNGREKMRPIRRKFELKEDLQSFQDDDFEAKPTQSLRIIGHTICCKNCLKELAAFYCPCGSFLCAFDMASHKCLITLRESFSDELKRALR